jgi:hypothetical protein
VLDLLCQATRSRELERFIVSPNEVEAPEKRLREVAALEFDRPVSNKVLQRTWR